MKCILFRLELKLSEWIWVRTFAAAAALKIAKICVPPPLEPFISLSPYLAVCILCLFLALLILFYFIFYRCWRSTPSAAYIFMSVQFSQPDGNWVGGPGRRIRWRSRNGQKKNPILPKNKKSLTTTSPCNPHVPHWLILIQLSPAHLWNLKNQTHCGEGGRVEGRGGRWSNQVSKLRLDTRRCPCFNFWDLHLFYNSTDRECVQLTPRILTCLDC